MKKTSISDFNINSAETRYQTSVEYIDKVKH